MASVLEQPTFDIQQYNPLGQSVAPTNPGASVDYSNDSRSPLDFKQNLIQAQIDTAPLRDFDSDKHIQGNNGYVFEKGDYSRSTQAATVAQNYFDAYFSNKGDPMAAGSAASKAVSDMDARKKRESLIPQLVASRKYNDMDVDKWRDTGDLADLTRNQGKYVAMGKGAAINTLTGDVVTAPNQGAGTATQSGAVQSQPGAVQSQLGYQTINGVDYIGTPDNKGGIKLAPASKEQKALYGAPANGSQAGDSSIGIDNAAGAPNSQNMQITDPDGTVWHVATNSRGTPIVDSKTGMATVYDDNGQTSSRVYNPTYVQQSGQVATEGLNSINALRSSGLLHNTGSGLTDKAKRAYADATGGNYTADLQSHFSTVNDQVHTFAVNKLIQEGVRPTEELVKAEMNRYGHLDINNSEARNLAILDKIQGAFNSGYHMAANHATHTDMKQTNYSSPGSVAPTGSAAATKSKPMSDEELLKKYGG